MNDPTWPRPLVHAVWSSCCLVLGLLVVGAAAETGSRAERKSLSATAAGSDLVAPGSALTGRLDVAYKDGRLDVQADRIEISVLLKRIAEKVGLPIEIGDGVAGTVSATFTGLSLEEGINRVLQAFGEKNLSVEYSRKPGAQKSTYAVEKIRILRSAVAAATGEVSAAERREILAKREKDYRDFFNELFRDKNKIARAIKEYRDPDTSESKRIKLRIFLRQTPVDSAEDKNLLKEVLLSSDVNDELTDDIQMALMHAIQRHPEEADKEYILALLKKNDNRVGWLYYAMLNVWDLRFVPFLMQGAREGSDIDIEILGRKQIREVLPLLEDMIQKRIPVSDHIRGMALTAWLQITSARYPKTYPPFEKRR